jgi:hypothetical protein
MIKLRSNFFSFALLCMVGKSLGYSSAITSNDARKPFCACACVSAIAREIMTGTAYKGRLLVRTLAPLDHTGAL